MKGGESVSVENPMVKDHPQEDVYEGTDVCGDDVLKGDYILIHEGEVILESNAIDYLCDFLGAEKRVAGQNE